jgi:hypothetical protein
MCFFVEAFTLTYTFPPGEHEVKAVADDYPSVPGACCTTTVTVVDSMLGACCMPTGHCQIESAGDCSAAGGTFRGECTTCPANPLCGSEGDLDGSGGVDGNDVPCVTACSAMMPPPPGCDCALADLDGDGDVDSDDVNLFVCIALDLWPDC